MFYNALYLRSVTLKCTSDKKRLTTQNTDINCRLKQTGVEMDKLKVMAARYCPPIPTSVMLSQFCFQPSWPNSYSSSLVTSTAVIENGRTGKNVTFTEFIIRRGRLSTRGVKVQCERPQPATYHFLTHTICVTYGLCELPNQGLKHSSKEIPNTDDRDRPKTGQSNYSFCFSRIIHSLTSSRVQISCQLNKIVLFVPRVLPQFLIFSLIMFRIHFW